MPNPSIILTPAAIDGGGVGAGKTPSSNSIGTSITVAKIEKTTLKQRCNAAQILEGYELTQTWPSKGDIIDGSSES
jgi:hypothetical protein